MSHADAGTMPELNYFNIINIIHAYGAVIGSVTYRFC